MSPQRCYICSLYCALIGHVENFYLFLSFPLIHPIVRFASLASSPVSPQRHPQYSALLGQLPTALRSHLLERSRQARTEHGGEGSSVGVIMLPESSSMLLHSFLQERPECKSPLFHFRLFCFNKCLPRAKLRAPCWGHSSG